jgi:hypothetical protein
MLFYHFDILDDFIKNNFITNLTTEKENIEQILALYENKKSNLLSVTTNMMEITEFVDKNNLDNFYKTISLLKQSFEDINSIQLLASNLKERLNEIISLHDKNIENNKNEIKANLVEYNKKRDELSSKILEFENINTSTLNSAITMSLNISNKKIKNQHIEIKDAFLNDKTKINIELEPHDNNKLIISEKQQKAYLPFFYSEVQRIYKNSNNLYQTLQDVVDDLYIVPLSKFQNSAISRFRESFHLIRNKENGSITKALDLGLELMFKYELNPIIIAACRNLDELDIYLDCLEENELYDFSCFEIKFEVMPQLIKKNKGNTF